LRSIKAEVKVFAASIALLAAAETITCFINPGFGMLSHSFILLMLLALSVFWSKLNPGSELFLSLSLAPLTRIISLSLPLIQLPRYTWYIASGALMLLASMAVIRISMLSPKDLGITLKQPITQLGLSVIGLPLGALEYLILKPEPLALGLSMVDYVLLAIAIAFFTGFVEELVFRGIMQNVAVKALGWKAGLLGVNMIFTLLHLGWFSALDMIFVFAAGLIFGYTVLKTGSIIGASIAHGLTNVGLFIIFPMLWKDL